MSAISAAIEARPTRERRGVGKQGRGRRQPCGAGPIEAAVSGVAAPGSVWKNPRWETSPGQDTRRR